MSAKADSNDAGRCNRHQHPNPAKCGVFALEVAMQTAPRFNQPFTKQDERRVLAELRERRNASPRHDPAWFSSFWRRLSQ